MATMVDSKDRPDTRGAGSSTGICGARKKDNTVCNLSAGWGTNHRGIGTCRNHGGHLPGPRKAAAKATILQAADEMGLSLEIEPHDLMLATVHATAGALAFAQGQIAKVPPEDHKARAFWMEAQGQALDRSARVSKAALDAGIAERRVRLAERTGALIASAAERAMGRMARPIPVEDRAEFARLFQVELARLEVEDPDGP